MFGIANEEYLYPGNEIDEPEAVPVEATMVVLEAKSAEPRSVTRKMWQGAMWTGSKVTDTLDFVDGTVSSLLGLNTDFKDDKEEEEESEDEETSFGVGVFKQEGGVSVEQVPESRPESRRSSTVGSARSSQPPSRKSSWVGSIENMVRRKSQQS